MSPASVVCPAAALTALALAAIVPRASCFARSLSDDGSYPVVTFTVDGDLTCAGALVSSKDVLTTAACAESLANDGKTKALLDDKTASVLCHNMNSERALALVRLGEPMCDEANPRSMFTPALVAPVPDTPTAAGCLMFYPKYNAAKEILVLPQPVTIIDCPAEGSKRSIETRGSEKVCANFNNPVDIPLLVEGLVLTCGPEASAPPVVGLLPARKTTGDAPVLESAVNVDKDNTFWDLSGTADCSAPKPTPFPCEPTTSSTEAAITTTPTTMSTATDTPTATTATATDTTATTATATGSSTASTADPATAGTQTPSPSGSPGLMAPPAPLLALAAARALTLLARRLG